MAYKTGSDLVEEARGRVREVSPREAMGETGFNVTFLDVREHNEWNLGHIPGALHIPRGTLEGKVETLIPRDSKVVIYCASGNRSALAADTLQQMGYQNVASMSQGFRGWVEAGGEVEA